MLSGSSRIKSKLRIGAFFRDGQKLMAPSFLGYVLPSQGPLPAYAFFSGKKIGKAVVRNSAKRKLRELCREYQHHILPSVDIIFLAKQRLLHTSSSQLKAHFEVFLDRYQLRKN